MAQLTSTLELHQAVDKVFAYFTKPTNLVALAMPEFHLELADGPELLHHGARLRWKARRWGLTQTMQTEITVWEPNVRFVEEQRQGPFPHWRHERRFEPAADGMRLIETIDFEPPAGLFGLIATEGRITQELEAAFAVRSRKLQDMFSPAAS